MKINYFLSFLLALSLSFTSCKQEVKDEKEEVKKIAQTFLIDFYYNNFEFAKATADETTKQFLIYLKNNDKQEFRSQRFDKVDAVELLAPDTAMVYYSYENSYYEKDKHILHLIKKNGSWLVHIENKNNIDFYRFVFDFSITELKGKGYKALQVEEAVEIDIFMTRFIQQVSHPRLIIGILNSGSISYYDIPDLEKFDDDYYYFWKDLSTLSVNTRLNFNEIEVLEELNYFITDIASSNTFGVLEKIEFILTNKYGQPYNKQYMEDEKWYKSTRWFVKGKNEIIELLNNDDGTISITVRVSEPEYNNF